MPNPTPPQSRPEPRPEFTEGPGEGTPGAPQHFAIADMRRAITEARNRTGMIAGMPKVTVDESRLNYVLNLVEAQELALRAQAKAAQELAEAATSRSLLPAHFRTWADSIEAEQKYVSELTAFLRRFADALAAYYTALAPATASAEEGRDV